MGQVWLCSLYSWRCASHRSSSHGSVQAACSLVCYLISPEEKKFKWEGGRFCIWHACLQYEHGMSHAGSLPFLSKHPLKQIKGFLTIWVLLVWEFFNYICIWKLWVERETACQTGNTGQQKLQHDSTCLLSCLVQSSLFQSPVFEENWRNLWLRRQDRQCLWIFCFYIKNSNHVLLHAYNPLLLGPVECKVAGWALKHLIVSLSQQKRSESGTETTT